ncbi:MAG: methyltransferase domain-containing protein [Candidatus Bipolaricaulota bacterium]
MTRSKADAKASYDRLSRWYNLIAGWSERKAVECGLELLHALECEIVLEIGYGTGRSIVALARAVGPSGRVVGIDLSEGMRRIAASRVRKAGLSGRVELICGDAVALPYDNGSMEAVFMSFTLELFDTPQIPVLLAECYRTLSPGGRIAVVSMQKKTQRGLAQRIYEWAHEKMPKVLDCRPIHADRALAEAGFQVTQRSEMSMWGLPVSIVMAKKP